MKRTITCLLIYLSAIGPALCGIGDIDKRTYVDWSERPYNNYVRICNRYGCGTGQFISAAHILTSKQVANCCGIGKNNECMVYTSDGDKLLSHVIMAGGGLGNCSFNKLQDIGSGMDWSVLALNNPNDVKTRIKTRRHGLEYSESTTATRGLTRAGFGDLKVLSNSDIVAIKDSYDQWLKKVYPLNAFDRMKESRRGADMQLLNYDINGQRGRRQYDTFLTEFRNRTGKDFINEYLNDSDKLKAISDCAIKSGRSGLITHTCDAWRGDSGGAILDYLNRIVAITGSSSQVIAGTGNMNTGVGINSIAPHFKEVLATPIYAEQYGNNSHIAYTRADGSRFLKSYGSRAWRKNNPGNIIFAYQKQAIGRGTRFAVFPTEDIGMSVLRDLLASDAYRNHTIASAIRKYAPASDNNNPERYARALANSMGISINTRIRDLSDRQLEQLANEIKRIEGWTPGTEREL